MADKKISQLTELATAADDDSLVILDKDTDVTKRIEVSNLVGTNELLLKTASTLTSSPQAVQSVGSEVSALQISSVGVKAAGTLTATGTATLASATLSGDLTIGSGETVDTILDEDTMSSDDPNALATQQSIKAYVDTQITTEDTLAELNDTTITAPASGDIIIYDGSDSWDNKQVSGDASMDNAGAVVVDGLQGRSVASTAPSDGQSLAWDSGTSAWTPSAVGTGTVTSVAISGNDGIDVDSGSPITTAGTISLGLSNVDASAIANGTVSDAEFQYIGGLTSDAQAQIDAKGSGTLTAVTGATPVNSSGGTTPEISIDDATTSAKGAASFSSDNFSVTAGAVSIKDNGVTVDELADIARGSIIYGNASAATVELTKGVANSILTSDGTDLSWATSYTGNVTGDLTGNADTVTNGVYTTDNLSVLSATTSAQLAGVISDETGSGELVFATSPTLVSPALGTPGSGILTSCTGYPGDSSLVTTGTVTSGTWGTGSVIGGTTMTLGSDAEGDIYYRNSSGILTRLGVGSDDDVLTLASGLPSWTAGASGTVTSITPGADTGSGSAITTIGTLTSTGGNGIDTSVTGTTTTFDLDLNELTNDTGTASTGWSAGDFVAIVDSTDNSSKKIKLPAEIIIACSDETTSIEDTGVKASFLVPRAMTVTEVKLSLSGADTTGLQLNVEYRAADPSSSGTDMLNSELDSGADNYYATTTTFDGSASSYSLDANDFVAVDVSSTGDLMATGLKVYLLGYWT
jgi:hypothetical protein